MMSNLASSERVDFCSPNTNSQTNESKKTKASHLEAVIDFYNAKATKTIKETTQNLVNTTLENKNPNLDEDPRHEFALRSMFLNETCESGIANPSEEYFRNLYTKDRLSALTAMNCINKIFMDCFGLDNKHNNTLVGILHMLSHFSYADVYPLGQTMAIAALNHKNLEVCEYAIKCFENWGHKDSIDKLKNVQFAAGWLQKYADEIIRELEGR